MSSPPDPKAASDPTIVGLSAADATAAESMAESGPSLVDQKVVEAAIRRGLITAVQGGMILENVTAQRGGATALGSLVERGLVTKDAANDLEDEVKTDFVPGYRLLGELGRGAMGVVYKAVQKRLDRAVALKVVNPAQAGDAAYLRRFKQEALALAKLNHPNIVQVYDYGEVQGKVYLALEFIEGKDASGVLAERGRLPEVEAARIVRDAAQGLAHASEAGIIHRDVKPANMMLVKAKDGRAGEFITKVTDLGLARVAETGKGQAEMTKAGTILGSPAYMAPEQTRGEVADWRADQYALGATLYHLLTGVVPYKDESAIQVIIKKQTEPLDEPRLLVPELTEGLVRVLDRMLARPKESRYQSYAELIADLEALATGQPPATPPVKPEASSLRFGAAGRPEAPATTRVQAVKPRTPTGAIGSPVESTGALPVEAPKAEAPKAGGGPPVAALVGGGLVVLLLGAGVLLGGSGTAVAPPPPQTATSVATAAPPPATDAGAAARVEGTLKALEGLTPADRLADPKALAEAAADVDALPDAERRPARLRLAALVGQALDATAEARQARLEKLLAAADYEALARATKEVLSPYRLVSREVPDALVELERVAGLAAGEEGARERALWAKLQKTLDPVEVVALADELEAKFPWSPALAAAAERRQKADAEAPQVDLSVEPAEAKVKLDGKPVQAGPVRLKKGKHRVEAEADGHFVLERDLDVQEAMPLALRLDPKPARPLVRGQKERDVWKPHVTLQTQWTTTGSWTADIEHAALVGEGGETWVTATRDLADEAKRLGETPGWQFGYEVVPTPGACEVRLLQSAERWAVVGVQGDEVYLGLREGEELTELARRRLGASKTIELDWDGKVLLTRAGQALLGSVVLPWAPEGMKLQVAARGGKAEVRSLKLRNLIESGAR